MERVHRRVRWAWLGGGPSVRRAAGVRGRGRPAGIAAFLQALPFAAVFAVFFVVPLLLTVMVSFWDYSAYALIPDVTLRNYLEAFEGCAGRLFAPAPELCTTLKTYLTTLRLALTVWLITLLLGFAVAYFLAFHVRTLTLQIALFLICTIPFWTSNVIRMIAWIPLLGRNGLINQMLMALGIVRAPLEWLLFSEFAVVLACVHLYTLFMIVPIFNSLLRIDRALLEAAADSGASPWQVLTNVVIPLSTPGIVIGSIFVLTIVMGDFVTVGVMGGQQIASVGKMINTHMGALQFPPAAAHAVILLLTVLVIIWGLTRLVDIRKEL
jgi:putative spermidine/putrescine transport system permease protein